jgi:hypothetical protein
MRREIGRVAGCGRRRCRRRSFPIVADDVNNLDSVLLATVGKLATPGLQWGTG